METKKIEKGKCVKSFIFRVKNKRTFVLFNQVERILDFLTERYKLHNTAPIFKGVDCCTNSKIVEIYFIEK